MPSTGECFRDLADYSASEEELNGSRAGAIITLTCLLFAVAALWAACAS